jgi:transcriptional regulator with XRE-family HTH domain
MSAESTETGGLRAALIGARHKKGWSQAELGRRVGLPQMHISAIETGKVTPRFDTLLEVARALDQDLLLVPRAAVPLVRAMLRERAEGRDDAEEQPLYQPDEDEEPER